MDVLAAVAAALALRALICSVVIHYWVAVKELKLSYYVGEILLFTRYTHYGNLIQVP